MASHREYDPLWSHGTSAPEGVRGNAGALTGGGTHLARRITEAVNERNPKGCLIPRRISKSVSASAVLFLLASRRTGPSGAGEPCVLLNKRSGRVRQPGDLCFPGGRISPRLDALLARVLRWPFFPLERWPYWTEWRRLRPREGRRLALLLATSMRESFEEMRLNPLGVRFLGPMPSQNLPMFGRVLYPMVGWIDRQRRFFPNWEVEKVVCIPLRELLDPERYACYRLHFDARPGDPRRGRIQDFPCFRHRGEEGEEILWGVTYRIVMAFLDIVFGFWPPPPEALPVVHGTLDGNYLYGPGGRDRGS
ncbi:MAG: CoA pyrophosphatase [Deltaproteobacteria bacterium]|nr:CoA pyrophosphatase [Deltaproteobacteria bacterium]